MASLAVIHRTFYLTWVSDDRFACLVAAEKHDVHDWVAICHRHCS
jgi:hypothetical protein